MHKFFPILFFAVSLLSFTYSSRSAFPSGIGEGDSTTIASASLRSSIRRNFETSVVNLYKSMDLKLYGLSEKVFRMGLIGYYNLRIAGELNGKNLVTIIDFTKPSTDKRFYVLDLDQERLIYHSYVAHGRNTGGNIANSFSNKVNSNQSSLGFYVTGETYFGSKGYSLRLHGQDAGYNSNIFRRAVVIHAANYVSESWIQKYGRLGRSFGCPALPADISREVINTIRNRTAIFAYYSDRDYLETSRHLNTDQLIDALAKGADLDISGQAAE